MKKLLTLNTAVIALLALLALPAQSGPAASSGIPSWHCQRLISKTKTRGGGMDYKFAGPGNKYFATYHVNDGEAAPDPVCLKARAALIQQIQSGYEVSTSSSHYTAEQNYWNSPQHFYDSICHANQSLAAWGGVQNSTTLIQTGMVRWAINGAVYQGAFWEIVGGPSDTHGAVTMSKWDNTLPYDQSHQFYFHPYLYGSSLVRFTVKDVTTGQWIIPEGTASVTVQGGAAQYAGNTADAVQERLVYRLSTGNYHTTKYEAITGSQGGGSDLFSGANALLNGAWVNFNTQTKLQEIMHDNTTNTNIDTPSAISSSNTFTTNRTGCGTDELTHSF